MVSLKNFILLIFPLIFSTSNLVSSGVIQNSDLDAGDPISEEEMRQSEEITNGSEEDQLNVVLTEQTVKKFDISDGTLVQADMILPDDSSDRNVYHNAIRDVRFTWPDAVVPYVINSTFNSTERRVIASGMKSFHDNTCIRFKPRESESSFLYITRLNGCFSYVGRGGGKQDLSLGDDCIHKQVVIHELMHALGFFHEQSRTDRDDYVTIHLENALPQYHANFDKINQTVISHLGEVYDTCSIMHYRSTAFSFNDKPTIVKKPLGDNQKCEIGVQKDLSLVDIRKINKLYKCPGCEDKLELCQSWAASDLCPVNSKWMFSNCPRSCKQCNGVSEKCIINVLDCFDIGYDYYGNDLKSGNELVKFDNVLDASECQSLCKQNENCAFWTITREEQETNWICYLKNSMAKTNRITQIKGLASTSGPRECASSHFCKCFEPDLYFDGHDLIQGGIADISSPTLCQQHCQENANCMFWTWSGLVPNHPTNRCYLKKASAIENRSHANQANGVFISGPRVCGCFEPDWDYSGADLVRVDDVLSPMECQKLCQEKSECKLFTWTRSAFGKVYNVCYLKTSEGIWSRQKLNPEEFLSVSGPKQCI